MHVWSNESSVGPVNNNGMQYLPGAYDPVAWRDAYVWSACSRGAVLAAWGILRMRVGASSLLQLPSSYPTSIVGARRGDTRERRDVASGSINHLGVPPTMRPDLREKTY